MATYDQQGQQVNNQTNIAGNAIGVNVSDVEAGIHDSIVAGRDVHQTTIQVTKAPVKRPVFVNVPPRPNLFVGRDELIQKLVASLLSSDSPALSAEGLPGVGKTTMAVALAYHPDVLAHFKDGVLWGSLGKQPDVMRTLAIWAEAIGYDVSELGNPAERVQAVKTAIGQRSLLLVIDDAWDSDAAQLLRCGGTNCCHILTTRDQSIARAFAGQAQVETVSVLNDNTAYQLLNQLAPEACVADPNAAQNLVKAVGGLPLTLELLGGYLAAPERSVFPDLSAAALADMSIPQQRLQLASQRLGTLDNRRTTLQETITLSVEDLPEIVRKAFCALGAFAPKPETFDRKAAEAITETDAATLALLIARNLVEITHGKQLACHQTLADVARMKTDPQVVEKHRIYYLDQINEDREDWKRIEPVYGQIRWAWAAASDSAQLVKIQQAVSIYQVRRGLWNDQVNWLERQLQLVQTQRERVEEGRILNSLGSVYNKQARWKEAIQMLKDSLVIKRQLDDTYGVGQTLHNLGNVYKKQGRWKEAIQMYQDSLVLFRQLGDTKGEGMALTGLGSVYNKEGRWEEAIQMLKDSLVIKRQLGDTFGEGVTLDNLANVYKKQNRWKEAIQMYQSSLALFRQLGDIQGEGSALTGLGSVYSKQGRWEETIQMHQDSLVLFRQLGATDSESAVLHSLGSVYSKQGRWGEAIQLFQDSLVIKRQLGDTHSEGITLHNLANVYKKQGDNQKALDTYYEALTKLHPNSPKYKELSERLQNHDE